MLQGRRGYCSGAEVIIVLIIREVAYVSREDAEGGEEVPEAVAVYGVVEFAGRVSLGKSARVD